MLWKWWVKKIKSIVYVTMSFQFVTIITAVIKILASMFIILYLKHLVQQIFLAILHIVNYCALPVHWRKYLYDFLAFTNGGYTCEMFLFVYCITCISNTLNWVYIWSVMISVLIIHHCVLHYFSDALVFDSLICV